MRKGGVRVVQKRGVLVVLIIIQTVFYVIIGCQKQYLHIDEAYSYGLANYDRVEIQDNEDFYDTWHTKAYYQDYLSVQEDEMGDYTPVYENQKNDVHPPLYYLLLRIAMECHMNQFSKWTGIIINIVLYAGITICMYLILQKLLKQPQLAMVLAFVSSMTLASLSNVVYIRMYTLSTLTILVTTYLHMRWWENKSTKCLVAIGISVLAGILTHYYYLFFMASLYVLFVIKLRKERKWIGYYTVTVLLAGLLSLMIFPYSIQHMFFGYRGQGVINSLKNVPELFGSFWVHIGNLNYYAFNGLLGCIAIALVGIILYKKIDRKSDVAFTKREKELLQILYVPAIFYFLMAAMGSPWRVLRYIVPVCGLLFVIVIYCLYKQLRTVVSEKMSYILFMILFGLMIITPCIFHMEPELLYRDRKEIVQTVTDKHDIPTIYFYQPQGCSFLDDILLFSILDESYIAKDTPCTTENIKGILQNKDTSQGIFVLINKGQEEDTILETVKEAQNFTKSEQLKQLTACNVYYLYR